MEPLTDFPYFLDTDHSPDLQDIVPDEEIFKCFLNEDLSDPGSGPDSSPLLPDFFVDNCGCSPQSSPSHDTDVTTEFLLPSCSDSTLCSGVNPNPLPSTSGDSKKVQKNLLTAVKQEPTVIPTSVQQKANSKKRTHAQTKTQDLGHSHDSSAVLSREELLKLSSKSLDTLSQATRQMSPEEECNLKRQRRLIKNRESAQLSRLRKKIYIEELEKKVNTLTSENESLQVKLNQVTSEKNKLQQDVVYLQNIIKQSPALALGKKTNGGRNAKSAGVCLLLMLFSFGLLFNNSTPNINTLKISNGEDDAMVKNSKGLYQGRTLKSVDNDLEEDTLKLLPDAQEQSMDVPKATGKELGLGAKRTLGQEYPASKRKKMTIADENPEKQLVVQPSRAVTSSRENFTELAVRPNDPRTAYIYCSEAQQLSTFPLQAGPDHVALLIPSNVLNATDVDPSLLEVSCRVVNFHVWPISRPVMHTSS